MDIIDLSSLKDKKTSYDQLSDEDKAKVDGMADSMAPEDAGIEVATAFLVLLDDEGNAVAIPDLSTKVRTSREPTANDFFTAASQISRDVTINQTAQMTAMFMQQMAGALQQQAQSQALANRLNLKK